MDKKMYEAQNEQMNREMYSGRLYLAMAGCLAYRGYIGMSNWMKHQAHEEYHHAMKFFDHIVERGEKPYIYWLGSERRKDNFLKKFEEVEDTEDMD